MSARPPAVRLRGVGMDAQTRCAHYGGPLDVVALRLPCCDAFYPCHACHDALAGHPPERWPRERFDEEAVLCGACRRTLSVRAYLASGHACPRCGAGFNPGCAAHYGRYFEMEDGGVRPPPPAPLAPAKREAARGCPPHA